MAANPGATVVTVTAGRPGPHPLTDWDRQCGFHEGDDVVGARRKEDEAALALLGAHPRWLGFLDRQYGPQPAHEELVAAITEVVAGAGMVASPLGLFHEDHLVIARACFEVARQTSPVAGWYLYEDVIYRPVAGRTEQAIAALENDGFVLSPTSFPEPAAKANAIQAYPSQVLGLGHQMEDAYRPERYWKLTVR